jgi:DNA-binding PadR family transcriptional regulator
MLRHFILLLLKNNEMTGTEIKQEFERRTRGAWSPGPGSVYPNLAELEACDLVEKIEVEGRKTPYRLTEAGKKHVKMLLKRVPPEPKMRMISMLWFSFMNPVNRARHLTHQLVFGVDSLMETAVLLSKKDKKILLTEIKEVRNKLTKITKMLEKSD